MPVTKPIRTHRRREDGFTLIELIVTVSILGVIVVALANVVIVYLRTTTATQARFTESQDVQLAAAYWQRDVASIGVRAYDSGTKTFVLQQSVDVTPACTLPSGTRIVSLAWSEYSSLDTVGTTSTVWVSYVAQADGAVYDLVRVRCDGSGPLPTSQVKVASNLRVVPVPFCNVACSNTPGSSGGFPKFVKLPLSVIDPDGNGTSQYDITLTGERRQT